MLFYFLVLKKKYDTILLQSHFFYNIFDCRVILTLLLEVPLFLKLHTYGFFHPSLISEKYETLSYFCYAFRQKNLH